MSVDSPAVEPVALKPSQLSSAMSRPKKSIVISLKPRRLDDELICLRVLRRMWVGSFKSEAKSLESGRDRVVKWGEVNW